MGKILFLGTVVWCFSASVDEESWLLKNSEHCLSLQYVFKKTARDFVTGIDKLSM